MSGAFLFLVRLRTNEAPNVGTPHSAALCDVRVMVSIWAWWLVERKRIEPAGSIVPLIRDKAANEWGTQCMGHPSFYVNCFQSKGYE